MLELGQEKTKGTARVLVGIMEFRDGSAADMTKKALLETGFDLEIEENKGYTVGEKIKVYRKETLQDCTCRR